MGLLLQWLLVEWFNGDRFNCFVLIVLRFVGLWISKALSSSGEIRVDRDPHTQRNKETNKQTNKQSIKQSNNQSNTHTHARRDRQTDRQAGRQTDKQTELFRSRLPARLKTARLPPRWPLPELGNDHEDVRNAAQRMFCSCRVPRSTLGCSSKPVVSQAGVYDS